MIVWSTLTSYGRSYLKVMCTVSRAALTLTLAAFTSLVLVPSAAAQDSRLARNGQLYPSPTRPSSPPRPSDQPVRGDQVPPELQPLADVVRAAVRGELVPTARPFEWENDFLQGVDGETFVPFTLVIDPAKITSSTMVVYLLVTDHAPTDQPAAPDSDDRQSQADADQSEDVSTDFHFRDGYIIDVDPFESVSHRISRAFSVPSGEYDVYVAVQGRSSSEDTETPDTEAPAMVMMLKEELTVPDLWGDELATSSVILIHEVETLDAPLSQEERAANPYTIGTARLVPVADSIFANSEELSLVLLVYNPSLNADNKPDVTVEYNFHRRTSAGEEYFNRMSPQHFNAETLPAAFDVSVGHQIVAGQAVPLSLFPEGDYRLEITVEDNASGASVIRDVMFTVGGP